MADNRIYIDETGDHFPPVLHRKEILNSSGAFYGLQDPSKRLVFNSDLVDLIKATDFMIIGVVIDKHTHSQKTYRRLKHPYHYALHGMLERYCGWLKFTTRRGDVMAEARGKAGRDPDGRRAGRCARQARATVAIWGDAVSRRAQVTGRQLHRRAKEPCWCWSPWWRSARLPPAILH